MLGVQVGRVVVVDESQKFMQILAGHSPIGITFQLSPDLDQVLFVLYLPQIVELLHEGEDLLDA